MIDYEDYYNQSSVDPFFIRNFTAEYDSGRFISIEKSWDFFSFIGEIVPLMSGKKKKKEV
jgi:hypothetical protein